jgi:hypothetical protein
MTADHALKPPSGGGDGLAGVMVGGWADRFSADKDMAGSDEEDDEAVFSFGSSILFTRMIDYGDKCIVNVTLE